MLASVVAHQGGWDEFLFVAVPIAIFAAMLVVANRRAVRIEDQRRDGQGVEAAAHPEPPDGPEGR